MNRVRGAYTGERIQVTCADKPPVRLRFETSHDVVRPTAGVRRGVVGILREGELLLVVQRSKHVVAPLAWCFPGGHIEPEEAEESALVREFWEELALAVRPRQRIWQNITPWGVALAWWTVSLDGPFAPRANPQEIAGWRWCSVEEIAALPELLASNCDFLAELKAGRIAL